MSNPSKRKGTAAETAVVEYLRNQGFPYAERRALAGSKDKGDISGIVGAVVEVKACKQYDLSGWLDELETEMDNAGARIGFLVIKRRGTTDVSKWYWFTVGDCATELLREWAA